MSSLAVLSSTATRRAHVESSLSVVRGRKQILALRPLLEALCRLNGQEGEADNLEFFLTTRDALRKRPYLLLFRPPAWSSQPTVKGYCGAVFVFEYKVGPIGLGLFATSDYSGRRNVLGREQDRAWLAASACLQLMDRGAQAILLGFQGQDAVALNLPQVGLLLDHQGDAQDATPSRLSWSLRTREISLYLPLEKSFDATLAKIGQKTRANLRYYRRRAESQLGCSFVASVELGLKEFLAINRASMFAVSDKAARHRWASLKRLKHSFVSGVRDADGRWLSVACGWRRTGALELMWQMNLASLPEYSLATVLRSYLIEHAIAEGCERLYIEGGTNQAIRNSFVSEHSAEITLLRASRGAKWFQRCAARLLPKNNYLGQLLTRHKTEEPSPTAPARGFPTPLPAVK